MVHRDDEDHTQCRRQGSGDYNMTDATGTLDDLHPLWDVCSQS